MNDLQRTNEWLLQRKGHITASEVEKLLVSSKKKDEIFGQTALSYIDSKIAELYMPDEAYLEYLDMFGVENKAMKWGTFWEDTAREQYCLEMGYQIEDAPFIPLVGYEKFAGGSPDGLNKAECAIVEYKCPANPAIHLRHFLYQKPEDLLADNRQYYCQCQFNMIAAEAVLGVKVKFCDFVSYDPRVSKSKQMKVLRLLPDKEMQENLMFRVSSAVDYIRQQMEKIEGSSSIIKEYK